MTTSSQSIDPRAKFWGNLAKGAFLLVGCFFIAPFIWVAIGGLMGLIVAVIILVSVWMFRPVAFSFAANMRLILIKREASRNPVETLQSDLREKMIQLDDRKTAIERLKAQIMTFGDKVSDIRAKYGVNDSAYIKLSADVANLNRVYANRCAKWKEARHQLEQYQETIDRANMIWEAGCAAAAARESSGFTEADFMSKLKTDTAFDAIQTNYNEALASLDTAMIDEPTPPKL